jgi:hypothetical protein
VKNNQRLEYGRLAEVLAERGLVEPMALAEALQFSGRGNLPFPEALVGANLVADWELSRIVCERYNLPFLTVEIATPDPKAREGLDHQLLIENGLVPLGRYGRVLTVAMPAMVPAEVLGQLAAQADASILPVVGTVRTNRAWLDANLKIEPAGPLPAAQPASEESGAATAPAWSTIFDAGDAAVLLDLHQSPADES